MKRKSHLRLGLELGAPYFQHKKAIGRQAFLIGCMQPDWNPATYLKGSRTYEWLRGHNYLNAQRCIARLAERLEGKEDWGLLSYYRLGKLIHYITDAFTRAHNDWFEGDLNEHRNYERALQEHFLALPKRHFHRGEELVVYAKSISELIRRTHERYCAQQGDCATDSRYAVAVAAEVLARLFPQPAAV